MGKNAEVSRHLLTLAALLDVNGEKMRARAFYRAADIIKDLRTSIEDMDDPQVLGGIGGSSAKEISEYLKTGTSQRLEDLRKTIKIDPVERLEVKDIISSTGVDLTTAIKIWSELKPVTVKDIIDKLVTDDLSSFGPPTDSLIKFLRKEGYENLTKDSKTRV